MSATQRCPHCGRSNETLLADGTPIESCWGCGAALDGTPPPLPDMLLGQYRVVDLLGRGGMSSVYRARHTLTDQDVAIKVLLPELAGYDDLKARFLLEAKTLAKLEHPNIVSLHNFVEEHGRLCLVMQFAEGDTFETIIHRAGRLTWQQAVPVIIETLRALEYAHRAGVIHRDIKPSNILVRNIERVLSDPGSVKVTDFGIAKITQGELRMTQTGQTMGTVSYMSPEQVRGAAADGRSDLYSLGVTLYEALTGRLPFEGTSHYEVMSKHVSEAPLPPSQLDIPIEPKVEQILLRAMAKSPDARFADAATMRRALEQVMASVPGARASSPHTTALGETLPLPRSRSGTRRKLAIAGALSVIGAGAVALAVLWPRDGGTLAPERGDRSDAGGAAAVSKDGGGLAGGAMAAPSPPARENPLVKRLAWKVDKRFSDADGKAGLRVLGQTEIDADAIEKRVAELRRGYAAFLAAQGIDAPLRSRPLTIALVPPSLLEDKSYFPHAGNLGHYSVADATLFIAPELPDLAKFVAFHLCPVRLDRQKCLDFQDRFAAQVESRAGSKAGSGGDGAVAPGGDAGGAQGPGRRALGRRTRAVRAR